jgi:hypothetical protein
MAKSKQRKKAVDKKKALLKAATAMLDKGYLDNLQKLLSLDEDEGIEGMSLVSLNDEQPK